LDDVRGTESAKNFLDDVRGLVVVTGILGNLKDFDVMSLKDDDLIVVIE